VARRQEVRTRLQQHDGSFVTVIVRDGLLPEDLVIRGAKLEGYRLMTGRDVWEPPGRDLKDYFLRLGVLR